MNIELLDNSKIRMLKWISESSERKWCGCGHTRCQSTNLL